MGILMLTGEAAREYGIDPAPWIAGFPGWRSLLTWFAFQAFFGDWNARAWRISRKLARAR